MLWLQLTCINKGKKLFKYLFSCLYRTSTINTQPFQLPYIFFTKVKKEKKTTTKHLIVYGCGFIGAETCVTYAGFLYFSYVV